MFCAAVTFQRFDYGLLGRPYPTITQFGQDSRVSLSCQDRIQDSQSSLSGNIRDDILQTQIHLGHCFLHMLYVAGGIANKSIAVTQQSSKRTHVLLGPEGSLQQTASMKILYPLAVSYAELHTVA
jgi:hypothetical protein